MEAMVLYYLNTLCKHCKLSWVLDWYVMTHETYSWQVYLHMLSCADIQSLIDEVTVVTSIFGKWLTFDLLVLQFVFYK